MVDSNNSESFQLSAREVQATDIRQAPIHSFRRRYAEWDYLDNALIWEGKSYGVFLDFWERERLEPGE